MAVGKSSLDCLETINNNNNNSGSSTQTISINNTENDININNSINSNFEDYLPELVSNLLLQSQRTPNNNNNRIKYTSSTQSPTVLLKNVSSKFEISNKSAPTPINNNDNNDNNNVNNIINSSIDKNNTTKPKMGRNHAGAKYLASQYTTGILKFLKSNFSISNLFLKFN
jgi:hypothetical protein